jgi:hypothetical protein
VTPGDGDFRKSLMKMIHKKLPKTASPPVTSHWCSDRAISYKKRSGDLSYMNRLPVCPSLLSLTPDRAWSANDRTVYRQQTLGTSLVAWLYPHSVGCQSSNLIVACNYGGVNRF